MTGIDEEILRFLDASGVRYELVEHDPVYTCPQMAKYLKTDQSLIAKSMVIKRSEGGYLLAVLPGNMKIGHEKLARIASTKSVSLAPLNEAERIVRCSVGCVHPLGNLVNVETYFDRNLLRNEYVFFNPGSHTKSIKISTEDLVRLVSPTVSEFAEPAVSRGKS
jgi:Ala-tRNA(Pro) deacylase